MENRYYVYQHIRPDTNQVFYVGMGNIKSKRAWEYRKRNELWYHICKKVSGNYIVEILETNLSKEEAQSLEISLIAKYGRICTKTGTLVNFQEGGLIRTGYVMSEKQKNRLRKAMQGNTFGKKKIKKCVSSVPTKTIGQKGFKKGNTLTLGLITITNGNVIKKNKTRGNYSKKLVARKYK